MTKRVHRKGFHIEWNKRLNSDDKVSIKSYSTIQSTSEKANVDCDILDELNEQDLNTTVDLSTLEPILKPVVRFPELYPDKFKGQKITTQKESHNISISDQEFTPVNQTSKNLMYIGYFFMALGVMLLLGSIFASFGFPNMSGLFQALVFSGNGFFVGFLGFLLFILIFLLILVFTLIVTEIFGGPFGGAIAGGSFLIVGFGIFLIAKFLEGRR